VHPHGQNDADNGIEDREQNIVAGLGGEIGKAAPQRHTEITDTNGVDDRHVEPLARASHDVNLGHVGHSSEMEVATSKGPPPQTYEPRQPRPQWDEVTPRGRVCRIITELSEENPEFYCGRLSGHPLSPWLPSLSGAWSPTVGSFAASTLRSINFFL